MKSRVGRLATIKEIEAIEIMGNNIENSILCYLRNNIKEAFYVVNEKHCLEITFLQAVKLFDATKKNNRKNFYLYNLMLYKKLLNILEKYLVFPIPKRNMTLNI